MNNKTGLFSLLFAMYVGTPVNAWVDIEDIIDYHVKIFEKAMKSAEKMASGIEIGASANPQITHDDRYVYVTLKGIENIDNDKLCANKVVAGDSNAYVELKASSDEQTINIQARKNDIMIAIDRASNKDNNIQIGVYNYHTVQSLPSAISFENPEVYYYADIKELLLVLERAEPVVKQKIEIKMGSRTEAAPAAIVEEK